MAEWHDIGSISKSNTRKDDSATCNGVVCFFFRLLGTLTTTHPAIFKQEDTQDGEGNEDTFIKSYGWILWIDKIANNEPLKWHEVEAMTTYRALNVMTYIIARDEYDKRQSKIKRYE